MIKHLFLLLLLIPAGTAPAYAYDQSIIMDHDLAPLLPELED